MSAASGLAPDAAIVLGLAATAMPFARSRDAEAERWLRILRLHGEAGVTLCALGVTEAAIEPAEGPAAENQEPSASDPVAAVSERAEHIAAERGGRAIGSVEVLLAVMDVYGDTFDRVLGAHGTDRSEVRERLVTQAS